MVSSKSLFYVYWRTKVLPLWVSFHVGWGVTHPWRLIIFSPVIVFSDGRMPSFQETSLDISCLQLLNLLFCPDLRFFVGFFFFVLTKKVFRDCLLVEVKSMVMVPGRRKESIKKIIRMRCVLSAYWLDQCSNNCKGD